MLFVYPAVFHKEDNAYWVEFPDLEGCQTYGGTLNETMAYAQEALAGYLLTLLEENRELVPPSDVSAVSPDDDSFVTLVTCDIPISDDKGNQKNPDHSCLAQRARGIYGD